MEISPDVSLLMVVPPVDSSCSVPGQRETLLQRPDLLPLPVQVFEMVHLGTYRHQVVCRYSRLSCIIELDIALAQHSQREVCCVVSFIFKNWVVVILHCLTSKRPSKIVFDTLYCNFINSYKT